MVLNLIHYLCSVKIANEYMKKTLKFIGYSFLAIILLLVVGVLLIRFVFRDEVANYAYELRGKEHIELLQMANQYQSDTINIAFELSSPADKAKEIRDYFQLDSLIKESNNTWDATLRIAQIAASIKHDNPDPRPTKYNAIDLWEWAKKNPNGFNCRTHSIMLHELLLSVGIANRVITCSPKDTTDRDCHVVNSVWLPEKNKWVMVDSDKHAYCTDKNGNLLSLEEMRDRIIMQEYINFNSFTVDSINRKDLLHYYWAKNLYYFDAIEKQTYNVESTPGNNYRKIYLVPQKPDAPKSFRPQYDVLTTDVDKFWAEPIPIK